METKEYPYTVEYTYEIEYKGFLFIPPFDPIPGFNIAVEKSSCNITHPKEYNLRYKTFNLHDSLLTKQDLDERLKLTWTIENITALYKEPLSPPFQYYMPLILFAPSDFVYDSHPGSIESWNNLGQWIHSLNNGRDNIPEELKTKIHGLIDAEDPELEKVRKVYHYVQNTTRYVNIALGIGGFQTRSVEEVYKYGYGDCKALSNYTCSILKSIGIKAYYTLISTDTEDIDVDFPSQQFNHVILYVPLQNDTVWLECTSQFVPMGYLGISGDNKNALVISENESKLVKTSSFDVKDNTQYRTANITIMEDNSSCTAEIHTIYRGIQYMNVAPALNINPDDQKRWLYDNYIDIPSFEIESYNFDQIKSKNPKAKLDLTLKLNNYVSLTGKRMFIPLNLMNKWDRTYPDLEERTTGFEWLSSFVDIDSITYTLPSGYTTEHKPEDVEIVNEFGEYMFSVSIEENTVKYIRKLVLRKDQYPPEKWKEFVEFLDNLVKYDKSKLVLVKK